VLRITHVRNSTLLLDFDGFRVLTDPWFGRSLAGLPAFARPGLSIRQLPPVHLVAVSHFHPDHWAEDCARRIVAANPGVRFVGPGGAAERFERAGVEGEGMPAGAVRRFGPVDVTSVACEHAQAGPKQVNFVFRWSGAGVYFGGDCKLSPLLTRCGEDHDIDVALLPVGDARLCGCPQVMGPADAVEAGRRLGARYAVPIHEGGLWPTLPPIYTSRGRAADFVRRSQRAIDAPRAVHLRRGEEASFTLDEALYLHSVAPAPGGRAERLRFVRRFA
jgi:N-acyl-phosphatidylethanolamine-hydrolysing phospholipase D